MTAWQNKGATLLIKTIEQVVNGTASRQQQDKAGVTFAPRLDQGNRPNQLA